MKTSLGELIFSLYSLHESNKQFSKALETANIHNQLMKEIHGEKSSQHAYSLFLKSKMLLVDPEVSTNELLDTIHKALEIEEEIQSKRPVKSALLGRLHYGAGTAYYGK